MRDLIKKIDENVFDVMIFTEKLSVFICIIGILGQYLFLKYYIDLNLYYISIAIFKTGILAGVCGFCFGLFFNGLKTGKIL